MGVAYEMARAAFHLTDRDNLTDEVVARKIIELLPAPVYGLYDNSKQDDEWR